MSVGVLVVISNSCNGRGNLIEYIGDGIIGDELHRCASAEFRKRRY